MKTIVDYMKLAMLLSLVLLAVALMAFSGCDGKQVVVLMMIPATVIVALGFIGWMYSEREARRVGQAGFQ